ncbi:hypothetical protein QVD17_15991 [Tagetes erecta]|uniref:Uncharacterized protein n=1 Tax=Tagetes erecta TaxID=13708 RepID=A0AAD8NZ74_TARER|nr:hypothetical protein QVD17_15991 [Tagetes erecta]
MDPESSCNFPPVTIPSKSPLIVLSLPVTELFNHLFCFVKKETLNRLLNLSTKSIEVQLSSSLIMGKGKMENFFLRPAASVQPTLSILEMEAE